MAETAPGPSVNRAGHRERRRKYRKSAEDLCLVTVDMEPAGFGLMLDISEGGLGAQVMTKVDPGTNVKIAFTIPDLSTPIEGSGVITWSDGHGRAGIRFENLAEGNAVELRKWVDSLPGVSIREPQRVQAQSQLQPISREQIRAIRAQIAASHLDADVVLQFLMERVIELTRATGGAIALLDADTMVCRASCGLAPEVGATIGTGSVLTTECVRTAKVVRCNDTETDARVDRQICRDLNLRSALIVPILFAGTVRGVLEVFSPAPDAFSDHHLALLEQLTDFTSQIVYGLAPAETPGMDPTKEKIRQPEHTSVSALLAASAVTRTSSNSAAAAPALAPIKSTDTVVPPLTTKPVALAASLPVASRPAILEPGAEEEGTSKSLRIILLAAVAIVLLAVLGGGWFLSRGSKATQIPIETVNTPVPVASEATPPMATATPPMATATPPMATPSVATQSPQRNPTAPAVLAADTIRDTATNRTLEVPDPTKPMFIAPGSSPISPAPATVEAPALTGAAIQANAGEVKLPSAEVSRPILQSQGFVTGGTLVHQVAPVYPALARQQRIEGDVVLSATVTKSGTVTNIRKVTGSPILEAAAAAALRRWRYEPFALNGTLQDVDVTVTIRFRLPN